ncbi:50S ribosomal protein L23 [Candidatus Giovannonibacteria bacterium RIFCSPLOWO2_01_FULL_44_16]|nr:MAG: 50S ribosomal protein L23 [Candidatus Giovannonibacteria bacterium RIFCSPLOWO2_01_FULL_44_16]
MLGDNKYIFKVSNKATKGTLKRAIEERYKVDVESLNVLNMPGKKRRRGNMIGLKSGFKKAIVALKTGQTISEF